MESDKLLPSTSGRGVLPTSYADNGNSNNSSALSRVGSGGSIAGSSSAPPPPGRRSGHLRKKPTRGVARQEGHLSLDAIWSSSEVATAISRDLVGKAERWKLLGGEPLTGSPARSAHEDRSRLPEVQPLVAHDVDKHEVASIYVKDALAGRESPTCMHDQNSLRALKLVRNKAWNQLLNVCTIVHLMLPIVEIQRCLPCMGMQKIPESLDSNSLHIGWRPTLLGSMWLECLLCLLYVYDLYKVALASNHVHKRSHGGGGSDRDGDTDSGVSRGEGDKAPAWHSSLARLPPWQLARTCMVALLAFGLLTNIFAHYVFKITWHRWSRVTLPFLFISRRTYLKHFVGGVIRVLPRMLPVAFLMSFVVFFYAFIGYILYRDEPRSAGLLQDLDLFSQPSSSAMTFLRIFTSIPFMLDVEHIYSGTKGIRVMGLSYGVIMVIFLGALVPAVANRNFQYQSKESYNWVKEQRKLALTRAFMLLRREKDRTVGREDWVRLMACLRPDCNAGHTSALFDAAKKAEDETVSLGGEDDHNRLSKGGFFMLCALGTASFSRARKDDAGSRRSGSKWKRIRQRLGAALSWSMPGSNFPLSRQVLYVAVVVQGYQIVLEGDDPERRPTWAYPLGGFLIAYFCVQASLRMIVDGARLYIIQWRHALGMCLNLIGVAYYMGLWFDGTGWHSFYQILQASRVVILWNVLHRLGSTSSEVATRLEFVFPAVLRASFVLFSVTYSYSILAFDMYCATPLGVEPVDSVADHSMMQRWAFYKDVLSFASMHQSFAAMTDVIMLSNWPLFMDAAGDVGNVVTAKIFFYSFKVLTFYFVMPVMLGFIVQSYMAAHIPGADSANNKPALSSSSRAVSDSLSFSRRSHRDGGGRGGAEDGRGGSASPMSSSVKSISETKGASSIRTIGEIRGGGGGEASRSTGELGGAGPAASRSSSGRFYGDGAEGAASGGAVGDMAGSRSGKASPKARAGGNDGASTTILDGSKFATFAGDAVDVDTLLEEGAHDHGGSDGGGEDRNGEDGGLDDDDGSSSSDDSSAPVLVTSHARSMSTTFWGAEQEKDHQRRGSSQASTEMQESLNRMEVENASLRALVDSMQMDLQMANARLYDEMQTKSRDRSPSPGRTPSRRGSGVDASAHPGKPPLPLSFLSPDSVAPLRKRAGSGTSSLGGMEAIAELEDEEVGIV